MMQAATVNERWSARSRDQLGLPMRGTASEVSGRASATINRNTVRESKIVTPMEQKYLVA